MSEGSRLPTVDISPANPDAAAQLDRACSTVGFCVLEGHGLSDTDGAKMLSCAREVFAVEAEHKRAASVEDDRNFRGYEFAGEREAFEIGRETPDDGRVLSGPNRWPPTLSKHARQTIEHYFERCRAITDRLVDLLVEAGQVRWGGEADPKLDSIGHLRMWRYPAGHVELPAHADHGFFTLLLAPDAGLEVQDTDGSFFAAPQVRGQQLLLNVGRLLNWASNGRYRATIHRVRSESPQTRISVPFFHAPNDALPLAPPAEGEAAPRTVGQYVHWGYSWQREVNQGASVRTATDGSVEY